MTEPVIEITDLWTRYGSTDVHCGINLAVERGEVLSIVGGSGSGKTTLLRQMLALERPARGEVRVFGESLHGGDPRRLLALRNRWGVLFQEGALFSALTVYDNVALPLRELRTLSEALIHDIVMVKLTWVGIEAWHATKMPAELSGGMVKRIGLARAMALDPEILFLDEPTAGLDPDRSESFVGLIKELRRQLGLTVVMVTHDLDTLVALSSRVAVLADRHLLDVGTLQQVIEIDHPFVQHFFLGKRGQRALLAAPDLRIPAANGAVAGG